MAKAVRKEVQGALPMPPKVETGGNTMPDVAWIQEVSAAGELHEPDPDERPPGFLYDVMYQWEGYADEVNLDFFEGFRRNKLRQCTGTAYIRDRRGGYIVDAEWQRLRRPCLGNPGKGATVCHAHGSQIPVVKAAAQQRLAEASEIVALRLIGLTTTGEDDKVKLAAMNSVLDRAGIKGTVEIEVTTPGYKKVMLEMFGADGDDDE